jgi:hypothetical protein
VAVFGVQSLAEEKYYILGKPVQFHIPQEQDILSNVESGWGVKLFVQTLRLHGPKPPLSHTSSWRSAYLNTSTEFLKVYFAKILTAL